MLSHQAIDSLGPKERNGQPDDERGPQAEASALHLGGAAVQLDEALHDGEAEAETAVDARDGAIRLAKAVEDVRDELGRDPLPGVAHGDLDGRCHPGQPDLDPSVPRGELHRVREDVPYDLPEAAAV